MLDFSKLNDPEFQARVRKEDEERRSALEAKEQANQARLGSVLPHYEELSEKERRFVGSVRYRLNTYLPLSAPQEKWLADLAAHYAQPLG